MKKIWLSSPEISGQEQKVIGAALENNEISMGASLNTFRSDLEEYLGQHVGLVGSGTAALHLALVLSGISKTALSDNTILALSLSSKSLTEEHN